MLLFNPGSCFSPGYLVVRTVMTRKQLNLNQNLESRCIERINEKRLMMHWRDEDISANSRVTLQPIVAPVKPPSDTRWSAIVFTLLSALAMAISYADRSNLSTAIIPMTKAFQWDSLFAGVVLSAFWAGYACTQILGGRLSDKYGGEKILIAALVLWSIFTGLTPLAASAGSAWIVGVRILLGAGEGLALPAIHSMIRKYVPSKDSSFSASIVTASCYLGTLASNFVAPKIIASSSWQACFYDFAILPVLVWLPLWWAFITSQSNKNVTKKTVEATVENNISVKESTSSWLSFIRYPSVWAIIIAQYCQSWGMIGLLSWLPTYYSQRFHVPLASLGSFTTTPYILQLVLSIAAGALADKLISMGYRVLTVRHVLQLSGMLIPAICLGYCALLPVGASIEQVATLITLGSAASSLTVGAVSCNQFDLSPKNAGESFVSLRLQYVLCSNYVGVIFGWGNTASCIAGLIAVPVTGYIYDKTNSWDLVFFLFAAHYIGGAIAWLKLASDQPIEIDEQI